MMLFELKLFQKKYNRNLKPYSIGGMVSLLYQHWAQDVMGSCQRQAEVWLRLVLMRCESKHPYYSALVCCRT